MELTLAVVQHRAAVTENQNEPKPVLVTQNKRGFQALTRNTQNATPDPESLHALYSPSQTPSRPPGEMSSAAHLSTVSVQAT